MTIKVKLVTEARDAAIAVEIDAALRHLSEVALLQFNAQAAMLIGTAIAGLERVQAELSNQPKGPPQSA